VASTGGRKPGFFDHLTAPDAPILSETRFAGLLAWVGLPVRVEKPGFFSASRRETKIFAETRFLSLSVWELRNRVSFPHPGGKAKIVVETRFLAFSREGGLPVVARNRVSFRDLGGKAKVVVETRFLYN